MFRVSHIENDTQGIVNKTKVNTKKILEALGYDTVDVSWDDTGRFFKKKIGKDYADWTLVTKDGVVLPVIRNPNFTDKILTMSTKDIAMVIGNETTDGTLEAITLCEYLKNFGKYNPHIPDDTDMSNGEDEQVTIRYVVVIVPENDEGYQDVVATCYNYKTYDSDNPKNYLVTSTHLGTGSRTDGERCEKVYLLKTNKDGSYDNTFFRITNETKETDEQKKAVASVLGTRSTGQGRNRIQNITVPRHKDPEPNAPRYRGVSKFQYDCGGPTLVSGGLPVPGGVGVGNVSYGKSAGKFTGNKNIKTHRRDKTLPCTITFTYYLTTEDGMVSDEGISYIDNIFKTSYSDKKATWHGSLVTGEQVSGEQKEPPIKLTQLTQQDIDEHDYKTIHFPKNLGDIQTFP